MEYKKPMKGIIKKVFRIIKDLITEYFSKPLLWYNNLSIIKSWKNKIIKSDKPARIDR